MQQKFEDLVQQKDEIQSSLENLAKLKQKEEKEKVQKEISDKLNKLKKDIESFTTTDNAEKDKLNTLKSDVDRISGELKKFESELKNLEAGVLSTQSTTTTETKKEDKGFRESTKEFIGEQWDDVKSGDKWKEEPGKNLLRVAGFGLTGYAIYKGVKSLRNWAFGDKDKEEEGEETEEEETKTKKKKKKKGFWKTTGGKILKWLGIGAAAGTLGYWLGKKLGWIESDEITDKADDQAEQTVKLKEKDPEKFDKYKRMGENIDSQYNNIMQKEINAGWECMSIADGYEKYADKKNIDKDTFKATVPMTIDNQFSSVSDFLSEGGYYAYLRGLKFNALKDEIISWGKEKIGKILGPYLSGLTSFIPFKGKDWSESITNWFESGEPAERENELKLFFRQYAKVLNYTQDKAHILEEKIAEEKIRNVGNYSTVSDALDDKEFVEEYIHNDPRYKNFIDGKLHQSIAVMQENGIFDDSLSHDMEMIKSASDSERDVILNSKDGNDALQRLDEAGTDLTTEHFKEGVKCCEKITEDIEDHFDKSWTYLYFGATHEAGNTYTNNIQEFLEYSGLNKVKAGLKDSMGEFKNKFASGNITQEEIKLYKNQVNSYFAMKKEILIGAKAIQQMKSDNPDFASRALNVGTGIITDLLNQTGATLKHFKNGDYFSAWVAATIPLYLGGKVISIVGKSNENIVKFGNFVKNSNIFSVAWKSQGLVMRRVNAGNINGLPQILLKARYNIPHGDQLLLQDLIEGKIRGDKATKILENGNGKREKLKDKKANSISEFIQKMFGKDSVSMPAKYIDIIFNNKGDIVFMRNPNLRKMFFGEPDISWVENGKVIWNGYRKKIYKPDLAKVEALEEFMIGKDGKSSIFETLSKEQKFFAKRMLETGNFKNIEEVKGLINNVKQYNLGGLDEKYITSIVEGLIDHTDELSDPEKVSERIKDVKKPVADGVDEIIEPSEELAKNKHYKKLQNEIDSEIESLERSMKEYEEGSANYGQLEEQINKLKKFKNNINRASVQEIESLEGIYVSFLKINEGKSFFKHVDTVTKLVSEDSDALHKALNDFDGAQLKKIIKQLQKENKLTDVTDDAIDSIIKIIHDIRVKNVIKSGESLVPALKVFLKFMGKLT